MLKKIINYIPGVAAPLLINFIVTMLYASYLNPGEYGILNIYLTTILMVYSLTLNIFQTSCLRFYSLGRHSSESEFISSYVFANLLSTVLIIPFALLVNVFMKYNWWIIVLSVGANGLFQFLCNYYRVTSRAKRYNIDRFIASILGLGALLIFIKLIFPLSFIWPIIAIYGAYLMVSLIELFNLRKKISVKSFSCYLTKESIRYGFPLIGVSVLSNVISSSDQYILLLYLDKVAVGNYSLGYRLVDVLTNNFLMVILLVMTPELNKVHDSLGAGKSQEVLKNMMSVAMWIILPISFAIIIYAKYIIRFIFPAYTNAAHIMQLVIFASIFHGISMFTCKGLELVKKPKYIFYGLFVAAFVNVIYNFIFIPIYGIDASAHSSLLAYVVYNVLLVIFTRKYYKLEFDWKYLLKTCLATAITVICAFIIMYFFPIDNIMILLCQGLLCVGIYISISILLKLTSAIITEC